MFPKNVTVNCLLAHQSLLFSPTPPSLLQADFGLQLSSEMFIICAIYCIIDSALFIALAIILMPMMPSLPTYPYNKQMALVIPLAL